jgi:hypothetical protein
MRFCACHATSEKKDLFPFLKARMMKALCRHKMAKYGKFKPMAV